MKIRGSILLAALCLAAPAVHAEPTLQVTRHVEVLGTPAREPALVRAPDGTLYVSGFAGGVHRKHLGVTQTLPTLWKSADAGATWSAVHVGDSASGAFGNSDVSLAVAHDGTLYFANLVFDRDASQGTHVTMGARSSGASTSGGSAWRWTLLSQKPYDDRPWVVAAPDGSAHAIWNGGSGVQHVVSRDGGARWSAPRTVSPAGGSSHLAVGPGGELAVRVTPMSGNGFKYDAGVEHLAISVDGGATWRKRDVPGTRNWAPVQAALPRWVEPVAWDAAGHLYLLWTEVNTVRLARSLDQGVTWTAWKIATASGDDLAYYPYLVARERGELAATWFTGAGETLRWHVAYIRVGVGARATPRVMRSAPQPIDAWVPTDMAGSDQNVRDTAGEYLPVAFLDGDALGVATPIQAAAANRYGFEFRRFEVATRARR